MLIFRRLSKLRERCSISRLSRRKRNTPALVISRPRNTFDATSRLSANARHKVDEVFTVDAMVDGFRGAIAFAHHHRQNAKMGIQKGLLSSPRPQGRIGDGR